MRTVYSYYCMDIIHKGHILMMKNAKAIAGDDGKLIVGILTDEAVMEKKPKPTLSFHERMMIAEALKYADLVVAQEKYSPLDNLKNIKPDYHLESVSHDPEEIKKVETAMKEWGGKVITLPYYPEISSSRIKKRIKKKGEKDEK